MVAGRFSAFHGLRRPVDGHGHRMTYVPFPRKRVPMGVEIDLATLWTAAGVLAGLQVTGFSFRVNREIKMAQGGDVTWFPPADIVNVVSLGITLVGVFIVPILHI